MVFAHDTEMSLMSAAGLINTTGTADRADALSTRAGLDDFVRAWAFTGSRTHDDVELQAVRALRPQLHGLWTVQDVDTVVEGVNDLLRQGNALPQLVKHDQWDWHLHATDPMAPLATRMAVEAAMALVDVVRTAELSRLRVCAADDCADVVVDLSRNRSRRYCESGCGNRVNVAAYRARRAEGDSPTPMSGG
ncbi:MAG TPA: CGNR zinc finger domain-containing protein [Jiangellaceae bacterium]|nr:CGNR zinc finger domain-containing protein [Jiangellaceae bacterium]